MVRFERVGDFCLEYSHTWSLDFIISKTIIPRRASLARIPVYIGTGIVSYFDALPDPGKPAKATSIYRVVLSFGGVPCLGCLISQEAPNE